MIPVIIKFVKTHDDAKLPTKAYKTDNCWDVYAVDTVAIPAKGSAQVPVGLTLGYISDGFGLVFRPKSGLSFKANIQPSLGEIDNTYRGDTSLLLYNFSNNDYIINKGDKAAQFKVEKVWEAEVGFINEVMPAERGANGFGSSGK
jgi:deoxyuridine 5'-triphosphate nucleotidohydrolase